MIRLMSPIGFVASVGLAGFGLSCTRSHDVFNRSSGAVSGVVGSGVVGFGGVGSSALRGGCSLGGCSDLLSGCAVGLAMASTAFGVTVGSGVRAGFGAGVVVGVGRGSSVLANQGMAVTWLGRSGWV